METSTIISLVSLLVAISSLPISYWIAVRQVKIELDEYERRNQKKTKSLVADGLDEFFKVLYAAVYQISGISPKEELQNIGRINSNIQQIDAFVQQTGVLDRLADRIDGLAEIGYADLPRSSGLVERLQSIRGQISLGSDKNRYATAGVIDAWGGPDLQDELRKEHKE